MFLSTPVLDTKTALRIGPLNGTINAGDHTSAAFQTAGKFDHYLSLFIKRIKVGRTGINAKPFFAALTDLLVEANMRFFVVLKSVQRQFIRYPHEIPFLSPALPSMEAYILLNCSQSLNV
jgi:hypothetical protein